MITTSKITNYYMVVSEKNGNPILIDARPPVFHYMKSAKELAKKFPGSKVVSCWFQFKS